MSSMLFALEGSPYIELIRLLKAVGLAANGAQAQMMVARGDVYRNGALEFRKRAKIVSGDTIVCVGTTIQVQG